jgi:hypothetical protein
MQVLTQPDTSTDITRAGLVIGQVKCINVNPPSLPPAIRWYGQRPNGMPSGHARETQAQAAQDVADWADGKQVPYEQHAVVPLNKRARLAPMSAVGLQAAPLMVKRRFTPIAIVGTIGMASYLLGFC